jgi:hypothetical protein
MKGMRNKVEMQQTRRNFIFIADNRLVDLIYKKQPQIKNY